MSTARSGIGVRQASGSPEGRMLWETKLGAAAHATPITYGGKSSRQDVATVAVGGSYLGSHAGVSGFVAFALPEKPVR